MNWIYEWQNQKAPVLSEKAVDCTKCVVHPPQSRPSEYSSQNKCCEFSPFLSAFAVGRLLQEEQNLDKIYQQSQGELVLTRLGLVHSHRHRKTRNLCSFYSSENKNCRIWRHRPATCFTFFCVTERSGQWEPLEMQLLESEAELLRHWHFHNGGSDEDWAHWGLIMDEQPVLEIPHSLLLQGWQQAEAWYREAFLWLKERAPQVSKTT